jgi:hypothetical protein
VHRPTLKGTASITIVLLAIPGLIAGCGSGGTPGPKSSAVGKAPSRTAATLAASQTPSLADSESYVRSLLPGYLAELRNRGAERFGKTAVKCAPTGGLKIECLVKIPYERLEKCAVARGSVFVEAASDGKPRKAADSGGLSIYRQICYVRRSAPGDVERVPSPPSREEADAQSERESEERRRKTQEAEQRIHEEGQQMQRESQERQRTLEQQAQEAQERIHEAPNAP